MGSPGPWHVGMQKVSLLAGSLLDSDTTSPRAATGTSRERSVLRPGPSWTQGDPD